MAMFSSLDEVNKMIEKIRKFKLRNNIPQDFEFHYSRNAKTKKDKFVRFVRREVNDYRIFEVNKVTSIDPYGEIADLIACYLSKGVKYNIRLDENHILFNKMRKALRSYKVSAKIGQTDSKKDVLVQIADYLAGIASE